MDNETLSIHKGFTVAHLNIRSARNKIDEMNILINKHNIDVLTISESWLNDQIADPVISIDNYISFRQDRKQTDLTSNNKGGGLLIYVNHQFIVDEFIHSHLNQCNSDIEMQIIELRKHLNKSTIIVNVYRPPPPVGDSQIFYKSYPTPLPNLITLGIPMFMS